ncbi:MAG TPA: 50S ribosomal protein L10 [Solirubrobacteraceae bacterium]|jgi:large subunit ribosomal protein L10|nr:50S ribosomal protein L10 [Solirubrobacteraceae bacterium]
MNRDQKTAVIDEIAGQIQEADAIFAVDYRGISVDQVAELRTKLRAADARFRVVKNSLSERAADQAGMDTLKPMLVGPTALAFVKGDAAMAAKALNDTARQLNLLDFKGGVLNGSTLSADDVRSIARLPTREVLYAQLVGTVAAPLTGLARGLNALIAGVAIQLQAIADQGLVSGEAPPAAPVAEPEAAAEPEAPAEPEAEAPAEPEAEAPAEPEAGAPAEPEAPAEPDAAAEPEPEPEARAEPDASEDTETEAASDAAPSDD